MSTIKKLLVSFIFTFSPYLAQAQTGNEWNLFPVYINDQSVGYIYQTYSVGTVYKTPKEKNVTALRFICTLKGSSPPLIAIFWSGSKNENLNLPIEISINESAVILKNQDWVQDGLVVFRTVDESRELIELMKTGRSISFTWKNKDGIKKHTIFALDNFTSLLSDFGTICKTQL